MFAAGRLAQALALLLLLIPVSARAGHGCAHCGCCDGCTKVCRIVCDTKEIKDVCWKVECEDFCVPGPSGCGRTCATSCCDTCNCPPMPTCGPVRTRKKLVKVEVTKKVPVYKCVVVDLCPRCCSSCK